jgi:hypothetical protein
MAVIIGTLYPLLRSPSFGASYSDFLSAPTWVDVVALTAGAAGSYTLPAGSSVYRLTPTVIPTYGNFNGTAVVPSAGVTNGTASFPLNGQTGQTYLLRPTGATTLSLICTAICAVTVEVWN